ncbi:hypothetical protein V8C42DRAFT_358931 [Trichoderma barbatum]
MESTADQGQDLVPTGIHWQVAQATSLQNLIFSMPTTSTTTAVGIFSENGSGGFVSNLMFDGGNIGWRAGSQQYTARNLQFNFCNTAMQMVWDWGWIWQQIDINGGSIAFNIFGVGGDTGQGTGSVSIIDTIISGTKGGILTNGAGTSPSIVLDNTVFVDVASPVLVDGGRTLLSGFLYVRERPQYEDQSAGSFLVATIDGGCKNDGSGDQQSCINSFLQKAISRGKIAYFPAGIYTVGGTVVIPTGSRVQGSSWSQIQGSGFHFSDMHDPKVMIQVGNEGDIGSMEIVEMPFSVKGNTAGAILMEWNTAASEQGAAAMWDSHFRVGGALGSDLDLATCPKFSENVEYITASLMFHVTPQANGYFENVWAWVADHDNDQSIFNQPDSTITQISIFGARGMMIESQGPSWFYSSGSEHSVLYNYLLSGAKSIYMGHIQTESPYFQPVPGAPEPFAAAASFPNDPDFSGCNFTANTDNDHCQYACGLQITDSTDVTIHGAGLYNFFNAYYKDCEDTQNCQERILEVKGSTGVVIYNLFTVATVNMANGIDGIGTGVWNTPTSRRPSSLFQASTSRPIGVPLPDGTGGTTTRKVTLPSWPQVNGGPGTLSFTDPGTEPAQSSGTSGSPGSSTAYYTPLGILVTVPKATVTTVTFPASTGAIDISCPATTSVVFNTRPLLSPPYGQIIPVTTTVSKPQPTDDSVIVPCTAWFFFICISWGTVHVGGWHWILPLGIYGPGPQPISLIKWPPGVTIKGNLPNWPKITIGEDNQITTDDEPECETETASACTTATFVSASTTLSSASECETITGCSISVSDSSTVETISTQTAAPIGTYADLADDDASADGTTISFTSGPTAGPTCGGASTACGGTLCKGYWCTPTPTGYPPDYQDPKDPSSGGYSAPTTTIGSTSKSSSTRMSSVTDVCNCDENGCDEVFTGLLRQRHLSNTFELEASRIVEHRSMRKL